MRSPKPKKCPFCAADDSFVECMDYGSFQVVCNCCYAHGPSAEGEDCDAAPGSVARRNAIRAWNKRSRTPTQNAGETK